VSWCSRSLKVIDFCLNLKPIHELLLVNMSDLASFPRYSDANSKTTLYYTWNLWPRFRHQTYNHKSWNAGLLFNKTAWSWFQIFCYNTLASHADKRRHMMTTSEQIDSTLENNIYKHSKMTCHPDSECHQRFLWACSWVVCSQLDCQSEILEHTQSHRVLYQSRSGDCRAADAVPKKMQR